MSDQFSYETDDQRRSWRRDRNPGWVGGGILILLGLIFLVKNMTGWELNNWWALFILIPAFSSFSRAYWMYRNDGRLSQAARGPLLGGFVLTFVSLAFLFNIGFGAFWPVLLIVGGLLLLVNAVLPA